MIHHVLKDGSKVESIEGHVIKADQFDMLYQIINNIKTRGGQKKNEAV